MASGFGIIIKYLLFIFNLLFFISGIGIIIAGAVVLGRFKSYVGFLGNIATDAPIVLIVVGVVVVIVSFVGCMGAIRESFGMLVTFTIFLVLILIIEIAAGIAAYVVRDKIAKIVAVKGEISIPYYGESSEDGKGATKLWNDIQQKFECCGTIGYNDWAQNGNLHATRSLPDSCCINPHLNCGLGVLAKPGQLNHTMYEEGCEAEMVSWAKGEAAVIGGVGIGIGCLELIGIFMACYLARDVRKSSYETV